MSKWLCDIRRLYLCQNQCAHITYSLLPASSPNVPRCSTRRYPAAPPQFYPGHSWHRYVYVYTLLCIYANSNRHPENGCGCTAGGALPRKKCCIEWTFYVTKYFSIHAHRMNDFTIRIDIFVEWGHCRTRKTIFATQPSPPPPLHARFMGYTRVFFISSFVHLACTEQTLNWMIRLRRRRRRRDGESWTNGGKLYGNGSVCSEFLYR